MGVVLDSTDSDVNRCNVERSASGLNAVAEGGATNVVEGVCWPSPNRSSKTRCNDRKWVKIGMEPMKQLQSMPMWTVKYKSVREFCNGSNTRRLFVERPWGDNEKASSDVRFQY